MMTTMNITHNGDYDCFNDDYNDADRIDDTSDYDDCDYDDDDDNGDDHDMMIMIMITLMTGFW